MTVTLPLQQLDGRKVKVSWTRSGSSEVAVIHEGTVVAASDSGILVKPRGASLGELIGSAEIVQLDVLQDPNSKIIYRKLRVMKLNEVRQHLADRHGELLSVLNKRDDISLLDYHNKIDHTDLGHFHEDKKSSRLVQAIEEAGQNDGDLYLESA